jgi:hypothetical protein
MRALSVTARDGHPIEMTWNRRTLLVDKIADHWRESGRWWEGEGLCEFFLVHTIRGMFVLRFDPKKDRWYAKPVR